MEMHQTSTTFESKTLRKLQHLLFNRSSSAGNDIRGFLVLDRHHRKIGTICDVFCDRDTLKPRYIEITPLNKKIEGSIMYPYDYVKWFGNDGPAFITSSAKALVEHEKYDFEHVMQTEGAELVTFNETLEAESQEFFSDFEFQDCA